MKRQIMRMLCGGALLLSVACAGRAMAQDGVEQAGPIVWAREGRIYSKQPANAPVTKPKAFFRQFQNASYVPGEVYVQFRQESSPAQKTAAHKTAGMQKVERTFEKRLPGTMRVSVPVGKEREAIDAYLDNPDVVYAEPVYLAKQFNTPNDSRWDDLWAMRRIRAHDSWDFFTGDPNFRIGVVDSGLNYLHPDINANVWVNPGEIPNNGIDDDNNGYKDDVRGWNVAFSTIRNEQNGDIADSANHHGTHVAGTIGAFGNNSLGVAGVNWRCKIVMARCGRGDRTIYNSVDGLEYLLDIGVKVSNHSYGSGYSQTAYNMFYHAQQEGHIAICAAGNGGEDEIGDNNDATPQYPASYELNNIIAVANHDDDNDLTSSSNYGATSVDLAAPGANILSTLSGSGYDYKGGTSMASPHVAGAVALVWSRWPYLTWEQVRARILTAVAGGSAFTGKVASNGRLDLARPMGVWTQYGFDETRWGTFSAPYNSISEALPWVPVHGHLMIRPVTTNWTGLITKPMYIEAPQGTVILGVQ